MDEAGWEALGCAFREPHCKPSSRAAFHAFREDVLTLSDRRDELSHGVFGVTGHAHGFAILVTHWPKTDWRERFDRWAAKWAHVKRRYRPDPTPGGTTHAFYREHHTTELLAAIESSHQHIKDIADAVGRGEQFDLPSTPLIPEALARLAREFR